MSLISFFGGIWNIALVIVGLGLIIFLHELGHFLMAKKNGVRVDVFSLGFEFGSASLILWKRKWGETEYRISAIPLGGYVKMAGETLLDERKGAPDELTSKTAWQRLQIFSAGAIMNLIIAFPIGIVAYLVGLHERSNEIAVPGVAETAAGILPGDVVVQVDGRRIDSLNKYLIEMLRRPVGSRPLVRVVRDGKELPPLTVEVMPSPYHARVLPPTTAVGSVGPDSPAWKAGIREGDEIFKVNGRRVFSMRQVDEAIRKSPGAPVALTIRRRDADWRIEEFTCDLTPQEKTWHVFPQDARILEPVVLGVPQGQPSSGKLQPGDRIVRIDDRDVNSWKDLTEIVEGSLEAKRPLGIEVVRDGKPARVTVSPAHGATGRGAIGVEQKTTGTLAVVAPDSPFAKAGFQSGDVVVEIDGDDGGGKVVTLAGTRKTPGILGLRLSGPRTAKVRVKRGKEILTVELSTVPQVEGDAGALGFSVNEAGSMHPALSQPYRRRGLGDAVAAGLREPFDIGVMTFEVLRKIFAGHESASNLSGPVGIFQVSYHSADLSFGNLLWILCVITTSLGIFNLLPVPILDGGHVLLLAIEKLRGKPPSEGFVIAFQYTGLFLILGLFVFVMWNDITRLL
jgi:regulator of sigma E protease